jgi:hypothetical protein
MREAPAMIRRLIILLFAVCLANAAWAGEAAKKEKKPEPGTSVEMPFLVAPMSQDGNLLGYSYISSKLICSSPNACIAVRQKLAFIQDGYVRDVNLKPIALASDPKAVDKDLLSARLTAVAKRIVGSDKVTGTMFLEIRFSPLHPSDSTANVPPPEQAPAQGAADEANKGDGTAKNASSEGATSKPAAGPSH